ncbi:MAG: serine/threonine-protein kinase [Acidobacteria bacterium]|nr:MAG: serine/threonine-protein kinase [Acidobacteriota bacterium]
MDGEPESRVEALCLEALSKDQAERAAFLDNACGEDADLRREVESLLAGCSKEGAFLATPVWGPVMPLSPGTRLGPYEILSLIGEGGMGQVYRARDARLDRTVALKILPPSLAADPERRARFDREAKAIASLNHPNICTLHDIGAGDGPTFLVMEHLVGETLAARLERGPLPLIEALGIAGDIAEALAAAHRQGVVHRDLKPGNVMLTTSGGVRPGSPNVKLLDFGLAKLRGHGERPVVRIASTSRPSLTLEGAIVGTPQYMAPEQVEGQPADARTDIWALGALLHEMVTGKRAFEGASAASLMASILRAQPPALSALQPFAPPALDRLVQACLQKDPEARWQAAADVARELRRIADELGAGRQPAGAPSAPAVQTGAIAGRRTGRFLVVAAASMILVLAAAGWWLREAALLGSPTPRLVNLTTDPGLEGFPALSPDGRQVAYGWGGPKSDNADVYVKLVGDTSSLRLTTDRSAETYPCWSPDGGRIAFLRGAALAAVEPKGIFTVSPLGGPEQKLRDIPNAGRGLSWSPDGKWLAVSRVLPVGAAPDDLAGIYLLPVSGGDPVRITSPPAPDRDEWPAFSRDGRFLAYARGANEISPDVFIQPLSGDALPRGTPRKLAARVGNMFAGLTWDRNSQSVIFSSSSALFYLYRAWIARDRPPERIELAGVQAFHPSTSPGSDRLAFVRNLQNPDIWRVRLGGTPEPFLQSSFLELSPQFSPDGRRVVFSSSRSGEMEIWTADADGGNQVLLVGGQGQVRGSPAWSPDGRWVAFDLIGADQQGDISVVASDGGQPRRLTTSASNECLPGWSRDGRWIYFGSDRTGRNEIWRAPFAGGPWEQVTSGGGEQAFESTDGKTLFYTRSTPGNAGLMRGELIAKPLDGRPEERVLERVNGGVAIAENGIYYLQHEGGLQVPTRLMFHDFSSRKSTELTQIANSGGLGIAVSPDRSTVLYVATTPGGTDLMLIENFR